MVDKDSAVIDGSYEIGFKKKHRDMQRFETAKEDDYQDILLYLRQWIESISKRTSGTYQLYRSTQQASYARCICILILTDLWISNSTTSGNNTAKDKRAAR